MSCRAGEGRHGGLVKSPLGCMGISGVSGRPDKTTRRANQITQYLL